MKPPTTPETVTALRTMAKVLRLMANYVEVQDDDALRLESVQAQIKRYKNQSAHEWHTVERFVRPHTGLARHLEFRTPSRATPQQGGA